MPFTIVGFLFGQSLATNQGADQQQATQVGLIGSVLGVTPVGLIVTLISAAILRTKQNPDAPSAATAIA